MDRKGELMQILVIGLQSNLSYEVIKYLQTNSGMTITAWPVAGAKVKELEGVHLVSGDVRCYEDVKRHLTGKDIVIVLEALDHGLAKVNTRLSKSVYREAMEKIGAIINEKTRLIYISSPEVGKAKGEERIKAMSRKSWIVIKQTEELERPYSYCVIKRYLSHRLLGNLINLICLQINDSDLFGKTYEYNNSNAIKALHADLLEGYFTTHHRNFSKIIGPAIRKKYETMYLDVRLDYRYSVAEEIKYELKNRVPFRMKIHLLVPHIFIRRLYIKRVDDENTILSYLHEKIL